MIYPILGISVTKYAYDFIFKCHYFLLKVETVGFQRTMATYTLLSWPAVHKFSHNLGATANIRHHHTKLVAWVTWCPGFVHLWSQPIRLQFKKTVQKVSSGAFVWKRIK
jgi:hypothetical protein